MLLKYTKLGKDLIGFMFSWLSFPLVDVSRKEAQGFQCAH